MRVRGRQRIEGYIDRLFGYAVSLTNDREQALELVQDCAVKALSASREPSDEPAYRAWLFRILRNGFIDGLRRRRPLAPPLSDSSLDGDVEVWRFDQSITNTLAVRSALARLRPDQREILALIDMVGFTYAEVAELLNIPHGTVMSRLSRARAALLGLIAGDNVVALPVRSRRTRLR